MTYVWGSEASGGFWRRLLRSSGAQRAVALGLIDNLTMRVLKEAETRKVFEKLAKFMGDKLFSLLDRPDGKHCFRLVNQK